MIRDGTVPNSTISLGEAQSILRDIDTEQQRNLSMQAQATMDAAPEFGSYITSVGENPVLSGKGFLGRTKNLGLEALAQTTYDPYEMGKILMAQDPNIAVFVRPPEYDEQGNVTKGEEYMAMNRENNNVVSLNKPNLSMRDISQALTATVIGGVSSTPAGTAARAAVAGGLQAVNQGVQAATGGDFDSVDVALDTGFSVVGDALPMVFRRNKQSSELVNAARNPTDRLPSSVEPDVATIDAAKNLGVEESLPTASMVNDETVQSVEAGIRSRSGGLDFGLKQDVIDGVKALESSVSQKLQKYGALTAGEVTPRVKESLQKDIGDLLEESDGLYRGLNTVIKRLGDGGAAVVEPRILRSYIRELRRKGGGQVSDRLAEIEKTLDAGPLTYDTLDQLRQTVGEQYGNALRGQNAFTNTNTRQFAQLYDVLQRQQQRALRDIGGDRAGEVLEQAQGLVRQRKLMEEMATTLLGKDLFKDVLQPISAGLSNLTKGSVEGFRKRINAIPEGMRSEVILSGIRDIMQRGARSTDIDQDFVMNPALFADWYRRIKGDTRSFSLISNYLNRDQLKFLDNVARISGRLAAQKARQKPTGVVMDFVQNFNADNGLISKLLGVTGNAIGVVPIVGRLGGIPKGMSSAFGWLNNMGGENLEVVANLLQSDRFRRSILNAAEGKDVTNSMEGVIQTSAFQNWFKTLPESIKSTMLTNQGTATVERISIPSVVNYLFKSTQMTDSPVEDSPINGSEE